MLIAGLWLTAIIVYAVIMLQARVRVEEAQRDAANFAHVVQIETNRDLRVVSRLPARWRGRSGRDAWLRDVAATIQGNHAFPAVLLFDPNLQPQGGFPTPPAEQVLMDAMAAQRPTLPANPGVDDHIVKTVNADGRRLIGFFQPLFDNGQFDGYAGIAYDVQGMLDTVVSLNVDDDVQYEVADASGLLGRYPRGGDTRRRLVQETVPVAFGPDRWQLTVTETRSGDIYNNVIALVIVTGFALSITFALLLRQQGRLRENAVSLERSAADLLRRENDLLRLNGELEQFAYIASHDLKAPLRGIDNLAQWMLEDLPPDVPQGVRDQGSLLRGRVARLEKLLDDILAYSRAGRIMEPPKDIDLGALVQEIVGDLDLRHRINPTQQLPVLRSPQTPLRQVLQNLLNNAIKHSGQDSAAVDVSALERDEFWEIIIADHGPGIEEEYRAKVFELFRTLKSRDTVEGSGLGLSIAKKLVEWQGGKIWIADRDDRQSGAAFHFLWPKRAASLN